MSGGDSAMPVSRCAYGRTSSGDGQSCGEGSTAWEKLTNEAGQENKLSLHMGRNKRQVPVPCERLVRD
jgi:hypothetical protein